MTKKKPFQWSWWVLVVFIFQVGFIWLVSKKEQNARSFPTLELIHLEDSDVLSHMVLEDPLSLARLSPRGFSGLWLNPITNEHRLARWTMPDIFLPKETNLFEELIAEVLPKGTHPGIRAFDRPEPELTDVVVPSPRVVDKSRLEVEGLLHSRLMAKSAVLRSSWQVGGFLKPSRVQIMVDHEGKVLSGVLLESSGHHLTDQAAMDFALKKIIFEKSANNPLETGNLMFHWHVDPTSITNILGQAP
tara:strand:+ start:255 stop:992 length:738 start_codon:yes stop_codon:yes gene_type:complete